METEIFELCPHCGLEAHLPVSTAAKLMGKSPQFVRQGLRDGIFPWGYAVHISQRWSYYISPAMFGRHIGIEITDSMITGN